ncbi:MAG: tRNA guanosine(15) transglycosylase TgtA [Thermoplasmataceae archaeon]
MEIIHRDGLARIGKFSTAHGDIQTPTILPVVNPNIPTLTTQEMIGLGARAFITNSYIIRRNPKLREKAEKYGVHSLLGFDGPIMTDSGTFQSHVYSDVEFSNLEIVDFQRKIGSDVSTILDIFSEPDFSHDRAKAAVMETYRRMAELPPIDDTIIAGPIQGSLHMDLRKLSAELMSASQAGYLPIGGVVPLLENYRYDDLVDVILSSKINADFSKPVHLFGGGHPMFMGMAVLLGVDVFDSASYVKYARDNRMLFQDGSRDFSKIGSFPRWSPLYGKYTVEEVRNASPEERFKLLSMHNLSAIFNELEEIREQIYQQKLWQYVEARSRSHPYLFRAFLRLLDHSGTLERFEDLSKKGTFFYFDEYSERVPYFKRIERNLGYLMTPEKGKYRVLSPDNWHPGRTHSAEFVSMYERTTDRFLVPWNNTVIPVELDETYPFQQMISSGFVRPDSIAAAAELPEDGRQVDGVEAVTRNFRLERVRMVADFQFGSGTGRKLFSDECEVRVSRSTGRLRSVLLNGQLLATLRAHDGFFTLGISGAEILHGLSPGLMNRIVVTDDSAEFNAQGYNVFFKFVKKFDSSIIAGNEVLVVDDRDNLVAVGKSTVSGPEMGHYRKGVAVKVHRGIREKPEVDQD